MQFDDTKCMNEMNYVLTKITHTYVSLSLYMYMLNATLYCTYCRRAVLRNKVQFSLQASHRL